MTDGFQLTRLELRGATVYLAGPMTGIEEFNFPAFHEAAADLRGRGINVWSPAEKDEADGFNPKTDKAKTHAEYMADDLPAVCKSAGVVVLPGWEKSSGATLEVHVARSVGLPVYAYPTLERLDETTPGAGEHILRTAMAHVHGARQKDYGHPADNHARTGLQWAAYLEARFAVALDLTPEDVCWLNVLQKISRRINGPHEDSVIDVAGYAANVAMIDERAAA